MAGLGIGLTAVRQWAADVQLCDRVTQECLSGQKYIYLVITEPITQECFKQMHQQVVFSKLLITQPVIRLKRARITP